METVAFLTLSSLALVKARRRRRCRRRRRRCRHGNDSQITGVALWCRRTEGVGLEAEKQALWIIVGQLSGA